MHNTFSHIKIAEAFRSQLALNMENCVDFMMGARVVRASRFYAKIWELMSEHNDIELARNAAKYTRTHTLYAKGRPISIYFDRSGWIDCSKEHGMRFKAASFAFKCSHSQDTSFLFFGYTFFPLWNLFFFPLIFFSFDFITLELLGA